MKYLLYTLALLTTLSSCRSVQKMVDQGEYDQAIDYAVRKLSGKEKKKTKYVKALERAFAKVNAHDMDQINYMIAKGDPAVWADVYSLVQKIDDRQRRIEPFLPLRSKDGYRARFDMVATGPLLLRASEGAAEYHYAQAQAQLIRARAGDKNAARSAHADLRRIDRYYENYKDRAALMEESRALGMAHILVTVDPDMAEALHMDYQYLTSMCIRLEDKYWTQYYDRHEDGVALDEVYTLHFSAIDVTPERENVNTYSRSKTIEREVDKKDDNGNTVKDTSGNVIKEVESITYEAEIVDITRTKGMKLICVADRVDYITGEKISHRELDATHSFESRAFTYDGDDEALPDEILPIKDHYLEDFPRDHDMIAHALKDIMKLYDDFVKDGR